MGEPPSVWQHFVSTKTWQSRKGLGRERVLSGQAEAYSPQNKRTEWWSPNQNSTNISSRSFIKCHVTCCISVTLDSKRRAIGSIKCDLENNVTKIVYFLSLASQFLPRVTVIIASYDAEMDERISFLLSAPNNYLGCISTKCISM